MGILIIITALAISYLKITNAVAIKKLHLC